MTDRQVVLITGARKGIGRMLVEHFLRRGALVEGCSREAGDLEAAGYTHHRADVGEEAGVKAARTGGISACKKSRTLSLSGGSSGRASSRTRYSL